MSLLLQNILILLIVTASAVYLLRRAFRPSRCGACKTCPATERLTRRR